MIQNYSYKAYVIGLGRIGHLMEGETGRANPCTHSGCYQMHPKTFLCGGFDISEERCNVFQKNYPGTNVSSSDLVQQLAQLQPEIISVCTSSSTHLEILSKIKKAALGQSWLKGILLEKPVGVNLQEGEEILRITQEINIPVIVCHDRRFYSDFRAFKDLIKKRGLGKFRQISGSIYCSSFVQGRGRSQKNLFFGGPLIHDGTHLFDLMIYYLGSPSHVSGISLRQTQSTKTEDTSLGTLIFSEGVTGRFFVGGRRKYFHFELELEWERAKLCYDNGRIRFLKKKPNSPFLIQSQTPQFTWTNPYLKRLDHLLEIIEKDSVNESSIEDGLLALRVIESIYQSSQRHGEIISMYNGAKVPNQIFRTQEVKECTNLVI